LDCAMFMQHSVNSEFSDAKQIAATVKFDVEEVITTDISNFAVAFHIVSTDNSGSKLAVFTVQRKILSDILLALQSNNIDPIVVEPDVSSLSRFVSKNMAPPEGMLSLVGIFSICNAYLIVFTGPEKPSLIRTFLVRQASNRTDLFAKEVHMTKARLGEGKTLEYLGIFDSTGSLDGPQLSGRLGIEARVTDITGSAAVSQDILSAGGVDAVDFAIAYGAALAGSEKVQGTNFRNDFMPYQGRKIRLQKTIKLLSVSTTALVFILGMHFQLQVFLKNKPRNLLYQKFTKEYYAVMPGGKIAGDIKAAVKKLGSELRRIENVKSGQLSSTGEKSVAAKLVMVLDAFNKCASQIELNINKISVTDKSIYITGDTSSRESTLKLRRAIEESALVILQDNLELKNGRDTFSMTVATKK